jgi:hypothetical protein
MKDKKLLLFKFFIALATFPFSFPVLGPLPVKQEYKMVQSDFKKDYHTKKTTYEMNTDNNCKKICKAVTLHHW